MPPQDPRGPTPNPHPPGQRDVPNVLPHKLNRMNHHPPSGRVLVRVVLLPRRRLRLNRACPSVNAPVVTKSSPPRVFMDTLDEFTLANSIMEKSTDSSGARFDMPVPFVPRRTIPRFTARWNHWRVTLTNLMMCVS